MAGVSLLLLHLASLPEAGLRLKQGSGGDKVGINGENLGVRAAFPLKGKSVGIWLPFPHLAALWDVWPTEHLILQWWQQQFEHLTMGPGQGRSFLFVKKRLMRNFLFFSSHQFISRG